MTHKVVSIIAVHKNGQNLRPMEGVCLRNYSIQNKVMHHESIHQIWWDDLIPNISTN
jgi:hypothetical protein